MDRGSETSFSLKSGQRWMAWAKLEAEGKFDTVSNFAEGKGPLG